MPNFYEVIRTKYSEIYLLYYESMMLNDIPLMTTGDQVEDNMRIESFLLHARNLIDFLEGRGHLKCHLFKGKDSNKISRIKFDSDNTIGKINEHLSHISTKRKEIKIIWKPALLRKAINENLRSFLTDISDEYFPSPEGLSKKIFIKRLKLV